MTEIAKKLKEIRVSAGLSQQKFADLIGIPQRTWSEYESGKTEPKLKVLMALADKGLMPDIINTYTRKIENDDLEKLRIYTSDEIPDKFFVVPLLDQQLSAGPGSYLPEEDTAKALIHVPSYLSHYGDKIATLTVDGDSMYPTLHRGDMVVCDSLGWSGEGIYALRMNGAGFVKRITQRPGKLVIISDNPKYPPQEEPEGSEDIEIIGRVHCAITKIE
jgi:phage repressor protein C with HTH and peptisase S24 domain/DNA-binding XRE family transcriptional regulator